jgi:hypothetical protein
MKIKNNGRGVLEIERKGTMKAQLCPYDSNANRLCGDLCPLFQEPEYDETHTIITFAICKTIFLVAPEDFTDERK